jgi:hypothetical protein
MSRVPLEGSSLPNDVVDRRPPRLRTYSGGDRRRCSSQWIRLILRYGKMSESLSAFAAEPLRDISP